MGGRRQLGVEIHKCAICKKDLSDAPSLPEEVRFTMTLLPFPSPALFSSPMSKNLSSSIASIFSTSSAYGTLLHIPGSTERAKVEDGH